MNLLKIFKYLISRKEACLYVCAAFCYFESLIKSCFVLFGNQIGLRDSSIPIYLYYILFVLFYFLSFNAIRRSKVFIFFVYYTIVFLYLIIGKIQSPVSFEIDKTGFSSGNILLFYPAVTFLFMRIQDFNSMLKMFRLFANILIWEIILLYVIIYKRNEYSMIGYSMTLSYYASLCANITIYYSFLEKSKYEIFISILLIILIFISGCRGALLVVIIYSSLFFLNYIYTKITFSQMQFINLFIGGILFMIYSFYHDVLKFIHDFLSMFNISSRNINLLLLTDLSIADDSGRFIFYKICFSKWDDMPIYGYGILGDRQFLEGSYVHNFIIEFITDYGYILGIIIIFYMIYKTIMCFKDTKIKSFFIIIASYVYTHNFFSGSYLNNIEFYILLGILLSIEYKRGKYNESNLVL